MKTMHGGYYLLHSMNWNQFLFCGFFLSCVDTFYRAALTHNYSIVVFPIFVFSLSYTICSLPLQSEIIWVLVVGDNDS